MKHFIWLFPFICFLAGYYSMRLIYHADELPTPSVIGHATTRRIHRSFLNHNLYPRILREIEDSDIPSGTILSQTPAPSTYIKPQQSVFLVISKPAPAPRAPNWINASKKTILSQAQARNIRVKLHYLPSIYPIDHCFAQHPTPNNIVTDSTMIVYLSAGNEKPVLLPTSSNSRCVKHANIWQISQSPSIPPILHQRMLMIAKTASSSTSGHWLDR